MSVIAFCRSTLYAFLDMSSFEREMVYVLTKKPASGVVIKTPPPAGRHHGITSTPLPALVTAALFGYGGVSFRADAIQ